MAEERYFLKIPLWVKEKLNLSLSEMAVFSVLLDLTENATKEATFGKAELAEKTTLSLATVKRAMSHFFQSGIIADHSGKRNIYIISVLSQVPKEKGMKGVKMTLSKQRTEQTGGQNDPQGVKMTLSKQRTEQTGGQNDPQGVKMTLSKQRTEQYVMISNITPCPSVTFAVFFSFVNKYININTSLTDTYTNTDTTTDTDTERRKKRCILTDTSNKKEELLKHETRSLENTALPKELDEKGRRPSKKEDEQKQLLHVGELFSEFWTAYPPSKRKADKKRCEAAFRNIPKIDQEFDSIMHGLELWKNDDEWKKNNGMYIPAPLVWLHQRRWESISDEIKVTTKRIQTEYEKMVELGLIRPV